MNFLDLKLGIITGGVDHGFGFSLYKDLEIIKSRKLGRYKALTLRDYVIGLVGSCNFSTNQKTSINRIYNEQSDKMNIVQQDKFISKSRMYILPTTSVEHAIKLYLMLDYTLDFEVEAEVDYLIPKLIPIYDMQGIKYDLSKLKMNLGEKKSIANKLLISVFKNTSSNPDEYGAIHFEMLKDLLELKNMTIPERAMFGIFAYANAEHLAVDKSTVYYNSSELNRKVADRLIMKCKKVKVGSLSRLGVKNLQYLSEQVAKNVVITSANDIMGTLECILFSIENMNQLELMTEESAIDMQLFSNICAEYNLSAQFITIISNKKELLNKCTYLAATYYSTERDILKKALQLYYLAIMMQFIKEEKDRKIDQNLSELVQKREAREKAIELNNTVDRLILKIAELTNELYNKQVTNSTKDVKELHSDYYKIIKDLTRGLEEKDREIARLNSLREGSEGHAGNEGKEAENKIVKIKEIDISTKSVLFIGHFDAEETTDRLRTYVKRLDFIDGTVKSNDITAEQMKKYDLLAIQYQFLPHTIGKFIDTARRVGIKVGRIEGTNIDRWIDCIKNAEVIREK